MESVKDIWVESCEHQSQTKYSKMRKELVISQPSSQEL